MAYESHILRHGHVACGELVASVTCFNDGILMMCLSPSRKVGCVRGIVHASYLECSCLCQLRLDLFCITVLGACWCHLVWRS